MKRNKIKWSFFLVLTACIAVSSFAQEGNKNRKSILPAIQNERAKEDYSSTKDSTNLVWYDALKYIQLGVQGNSYLTFGGSYRPRFEHFSNRFWIANNNENYYSQRLSFHTDLHLGKHLRFFGELQHGYKTEGAGIPQTDDADIHQAFIELKTAQANPFTFRFGRQEMNLGAGRLVDLRTGPNIRRSFDMGKITFSNQQITVNAFYGKEVNIGFESFDNKFNLFEKAATNAKIWGVYSQFHLSPNKGKDYNGEIYYLGYQSDFAAFSDVAGEETRHSVGIRSFGSIGKAFRYNTELIVQFGNINNNSIAAFNFETDWKYTFIRKKWRPTLGLKLDWSSGDKNMGDGKLNSFNPMFVNPGLYSLAGINTPINLLSFHPALILFPSKKIMLNIDFALFFRASKADGLYAPPNFQTRMANEFSEKHIGNSIGLFFKYSHNRNVSFDVRSSFFIPGDFVEASGSSESIFQITPTMTLIF